MNLKLILINKLLKIFVIFLLILPLFECCETVDKTKTNEIVFDWWERAQFYQIYPRSFKDSNGDGIGDLNGITSKLPYIANLGVTAIWLSPIFKSPMADFGYDISNFYEINGEYGTMADFERLIKTAKALNVKVILDFVPNHSSDENEWFTKSVNRVKGYEDFYVWHDGKIDPSNPERRLPPTNWLQAFRGSAWEWNEKRQQFYLHQFAVKQPDLNYRNPIVVEKMKSVLTYWLDKGVEGFRIDAVPWCFEVKPDSNGNYPDEPKSGNTEDPEESAYLKHIYTQDQPETIDMVYQWRKLMDDYKRIHGGDTRVLMIETYSDIKNVVQYYGNKTTVGAQIPFNFQFIKENKNSSAPDIINNVIKYWYTFMPKNQQPNWVLGNHDQRRVGSRYGEQNIDAMNMILMMLPGVSVTYMGEEIGMIDGKITWEQSKDPAACNSNPNIYEKFTRDPARTPFQWDTTTSAGFSTNTNTWLPVSENYKTVNVETELNDKRSHLNIYKELINLRKTKTLRYGDVIYSAINNDVVLIGRQLEGENTLILIANIKNNQHSNIDLTKVNLFKLPSTLKYKIIQSGSTHQTGDTVNMKDFTLGPHEAVILTS